MIILQHSREDFFIYLFNIQAVLSLADRRKYFYPIQEDFHLCRKLLFKMTIWCSPGSSVLNFQRQIHRSWKFLLYYFFQETVLLMLELPFLSVSVKLYSSCPTVILQITTSTQNCYSVPTTCTHSDKQYTKIWYAFNLNFLPELQ